MDERRQRFIDAYVAARLAAIAMSGVTDDTTGEQMCLMMKLAIQEANAAWELYEHIDSEVATDANA